ncbi:MAG: hypothetical protein JSU96_09995 [Acidobacteriota bacterium]|nr:MAG: hypothetical protein JSU96_09995 [Acidobacteriota bacterium]
MAQASFLPLEGLQQEEQHQRHNRQIVPRKESLPPATDCFPTGVPVLDQLLQGGIPRGKMVEIAGDICSGKTSLTFNILAQATGQEELVAYIDTFNTLDPRYLEKSGVDLSRVLWIRCNPEKNNPLDTALKALDILVQAGGFGVILLDIASLPFFKRAPIHRISPHSWFRAQRALKGSHTALLILSSHKATGSAAFWALSIQKEGSRWIPPHSGQRTANYFQGMKCIAQLIRGRNHGCVEVYCRL